MENKSEFKYINTKTLEDGFCESDEIGLELAYQLKRIADKLDEGV